MACQFRSYLWWHASLGLTYDGVPPKFGALGVKTTSDAKINVPKFIEEEGGVSALQKYSVPNVVWGEGEWGGV